MKFEPILTANLLSSIKPIQKPSHFLPCKIITLFLLIVPVDSLMGQFPFETPDEWVEARDDDGIIEIDLTVDADLKYNYSGAGGYTIRVPCQAFDTTLDLGGYYASSPTFVNYLRMCFRWGGMFGLSNRYKGPTLAPDELMFLTKDLLSF
jgi:hypothetical protein